MIIAGVRSRSRSTKRNSSSIHKRVELKVRAGVSARVRAINASDRDDMMMRLTFEASTVRKIKISRTCSVPVSEKALVRNVHRWKSMSFYKTRQKY